MKNLSRLRGWCREALAKRRARRLDQPVYPFAGAVNVLRRTARRLANPAVAKVYCASLPANMFCRVDARTIGWWILTERMVWMAQVDRENLDVAFAACVDYPGGIAQKQTEMREALLPLYSPSPAGVVSWEERLATLGVLSAQWMQRNRPGNCLPGLVVTGARSSAYIVPQERMRTALRLQRPERLEVAIPLILHSLWADMRQDNMHQSGPSADAWQLACALMDNPWESWQAVQSGRFAEMHAFV